MIFCMDTLSSIVYAVCRPSSSSSGTNSVGAGPSGMGVPERSFTSLVKRNTMVSFIILLIARTARIACPDRQTE